ncbi:ADP-ribose pyrophosphatase YjhB (NUDIX family) [Humibacillus xanthopallidus]|uniref:ADP-ribose pyrophosphatase YjhB (NUDIX family) n=1 Tax=Humibacillus xanthopallidus TaxID=412689 RepID=A0A543PUZ8_9MICO|nr:NUDIX hydrolase [Humibacillus xanthopallidus]TQN47899.1 ADP-ribose pyrophosphatase YjhB (NUDIX family) [Humibacillus xanthopallidus]
MRISERAHATAAALWRRAGGRLQWRLVRWRNATFLVGLTGVVRDPAGRVLVLEHRYWMGNTCGLPSGYAVRRETWEAGLAREVREETGIEVSDVAVVCVRSGFEGRIEVLLTATAPQGAEPRADGGEVLVAAFVDVSEARARLRAEHVRMLDLVLGAGEPA